MMQQYQLKGYKRGMNEEEEREFIHASLLRVQNIITSELPIREKLEELADLMAKYYRRGYKDGIEETRCKKE